MTAMSASGGKVALLPMDYACLRYLEQSGGSAPYIAIPARLFRGEIPEGAPDLVDLGLVEHHGEMTLITAGGLVALSAEQAVV